MSSIVEMLMNQLSGSSMNQLSQAIGADPKATQQGVQAAVPLLMGALASNARRPEGASSLLGALDRDHDGSILDDLGGFLGGGGDSGAGAGILGHVLGSKKPAAERQIADASGLSMESAGRLLALLAPLVMGALGRRQNQKGFDLGSLVDLLGQERKVAQQKAPGGLGGLASFLDQDGDGDMMDDAVRLGTDLLGGFLKGR